MYIHIHVHVHSHGLHVYIGPLSSFFLQDGESALYQASECGCVEVVQALLDGGANVELQTNVINYSTAVQCVHTYTCKIIIHIHTF